MRITDDCPPDLMLAELLKANKASSLETSIFNNSSWSNHDYICDQMRERIDAMLRSYARLGNEVHVTQSMRDNGVDVFLAFTGEGGTSQRIGIQIKSNNEAIGATKKIRAGESMEAILKRQAFESFRWNLTEWWVVLCFDLTKKEHVKLVKRINSELLPGGPITIRIYEPEHAWSLLGMRDDEVDARCVLSLCQDDEILVGAREEANDLSQSALNVVMGTLFDALSDGASQHSLDQLMTLANDDMEHDIDKTGDVLDELSDYLIRRDYEDVWYANPYVYKGFCALYFEGRVRHQLSPTEAANFVRKLMLA
jgi:hypothetical protein